MRYRIGFFCVVITIFTLSLSCGPGKIKDESASGCIPEDLQVDVNSKTMDVYWKPNCDRLISGYNIYISEAPLVDRYPGGSLPQSVEPFNRTPYSGDTDPDDEYEHFIAEGLENAKKYYVSVRIVNPDRTLSKPSNEVAVVCGPTGEIELSMRYKSDRDGYSFDRNEYVRADDVDNDLYFFSNNGVDYLNSPARLGGFLKVNRLQKLPLRGTFEQVRSRVTDLSLTAGDERVAVKEGDWLVVSTPDGSNALIKVLDFSDDNTKRSIKLFFAYRSLSGEMVF
ncbi:MAG: fibronectin type III domain-containing protein [Candidatus Zixiibacteriota bacterium]|nr:MAG: fibronectin type III domain-containing protein [candidate division Zixibacteria bacterium]